MAHIPEDRQKRGLVLDYSLEENFILEVYADEPYSKNGFLQEDAINSHANRLIKEFDVRAGEGAKAKARSLSGGNQQKAIVGREIDHNPDLLIAVQPTRGLDVGSIEYIHKQIIKERDQGAGVLLISAELDEIKSLADRIAVMFHGEIVAIVDVDEVSKSELGLLMAGSEREAVADS